MKKSNGASRVGGDAVGDGVGGMGEGRLGVCGDVPRTRARDGYRRANRLYDRATQDLWTVASGSTGCELRPSRRRTASRQNTKPRMITPAMLSAASLMSTP